MDLSQKEQEFLSNMGISIQRFEKARLPLQTLIEIVENYQENEVNLLDEAEYIAKKLQRCKAVHSVRWRLKEASHLVEKIIRKRETNEIPEKYQNINVENYKTIITDLIGVRAIHLFKSDWLTIHKHILSRWTPKEAVVIYHREGDDLSLYEEQSCKKEVHFSGYRSIHYLVPAATINSQQVYCEVQTRTIFEEGWSEIDHKVRYPSFSDNHYLQQYLNIFNRLAGSADEMGSYVGVLTDLITVNTTADEMKQNLEKEYQLQVNNLEEKIEELINEKADYDELKKAYKKLKEVKDDKKEFTIGNSLISNESLHVQKNFGRLQGSQLAIDPMMAAHKAAEQMMATKKAFERLLGPQKAAERVMAAQKSAEQMMAAQKSAEQMMAAQKNAEQMMAAQKAFERLLGSQKAAEQVMAAQKSAEQMMAAQKALKRLLDPQAIKDKKDIDKSK